MLTAEVVPCPAAGAGSVLRVVTHQGQHHAFQFTKPALALEFRDLLLLKQHFEGAIDDLPPEHDLTTSDIEVSSS